jgi:acyl carrier protein
MTEQEIRTTVSGILKRIAPEADLSQVPDDAPLRETLDIDSFDYLRFITEIHKALNVEIPESDYPQLRSLAGVVKYLAARAK